MYKFFSNHLSQDNIFFKHARGISERSGKEFHPFHEIIYFLGGEAEFISEKLHLNLPPQTLIVIPCETYHQMVIHGDQQMYYRCLLQFSQEHNISHKMNDINVIRGDWEINYLFGKLITAAEKQNQSSSVLLEPMLVLLLDSLKEKSTLSEETRVHSDVVQRAIEYINQNLNRSIPIHDIAVFCNVSKSSLTHTFKNEMHIPLHKFIVKKRLIIAHHKISSGVPATKAALDCGFHDYSGFYKQYKNNFGFAPSQRYTKIS